jgi:hypothetical protein
VVATGHGANASGLHARLILAELSDGISGEHCVSQIARRRRSSLRQYPIADGEHFMQIALEPMYRLLPLLALAFGADVSAATFLVGPTGQAGCTHDDIAAAVSTAQQTPGHDIVQIIAGTWSAQRIVVNDADNLNIEGGYQSCSNPVRSDISTLSGQGASPAGPVIQHGGSGGLTLRNLVVTRGDAIWGGGIHSETAARLTLSNVVVTGNHALMGGGIAAVSTTSVRKPVFLNSVGVTGNIAGSSGGGVFVRDADVVIAGDSPNYFLDNIAQGTNTGQGGGAIFAQDSWLQIDSHSPSGVAFMGSNFAHRDGGGIHFATSKQGAFNLSIANRDSGGPLEIADNAAVGEGGALYVVANAVGNPTGAFAYLTNTILRSNDAPGGSAMRVNANGQTHPAQVAVLMRQSYAGETIPPCIAFLKCNMVTGSFSTNGSTFHVTASGAGSAANLAIQRGHLYDNFSRGALFFGSSSSLSLESVVIGSNTTQTSSLLSMVASDVSIRNSTIANNAIGTDEVAFVAIPPSSLSLFNVLAFQPTENLYTVGATTSVALRHLMVGNLAGLPDPTGNDIQFTADPFFLNPSQYDYRTTSGSQAVNRWATSGGDVPPIIDVDGAMRPWANGPAPTPYDFGAYENGSVVNHIFVNGFDGPPPTSLPD